MTSMIASGTVFLPFTLNVCAFGPLIEPIIAHVEDADVRIDFPASMTEGAIGKNMYPSGWAWWVVDRLYVETTSSVEELHAQFGEDTERLRGVLLSAAQIAVRRLLNSYRWRMMQYEVHPVRIDPTQFRLELELADGTRTALSEPVGSFFYNNIPKQPPLEKSINEQSLPMLRRDILDGIEPPHEELLELDILWLDSIGESSRANELRSLISKERIA